MQILKMTLTLEFSQQYALGTNLFTIKTQIIIGIVTVLYSAPVHIAIVHQLLAVILWVTILRARFLSAYPITTSLRGN